ncbi:hypothetical protein [Sandaracinobacteroides hominis]|uniref:hypothetical protein n=1 Tax=Sandaracinobacteroides hominis TaxID=2780086 RepID=UPI0018F59B49|nr:hypothetical protein [Sandaracinobacteroides hominis]
MGWNATIFGGGIALALLILSARMNARRGIGRWSHIPWDYLLLLSAILLLAAVAHGAILWRDGMIF